MELPKVIGSDTLVIAVEVDDDDAATDSNTTASDIPVRFQQVKQSTSRHLKHAGGSVKKKKKQNRFRKEKTKKHDVQEDVLKIHEHRLGLAELAAELGTDIDFKTPKNSTGLTSIKAAELRETFGPNSLTPAKQTPLWLKFLGEFTGFFPLLLEIGGVLCFIGYGLQPSDPSNLYLGIILWVVVIITAIFAFSQEAKSTRIMAGFMNMTPQTCKVMRDGALTDTNAALLVPGDVVHVKAGDRVPADIRILYAANFKVDNSSLTGESEAQTCTEHATDDNPMETHNLAFYSTLAMSGDAVGVVVRTGDRTMIGQIANLASTATAGDTPLQNEIKRFIKVISAVAISIGVIFLAVGFGLKINWVANVVFAIGIIVANVPEGLLPTVTVALTLTARRMARKNVLVKNLLAIETLGATTTICSDKTGTLTQNLMTAVHMYFDDEIVGTDPITTVGATQFKRATFQHLHAIAALNSRATFDAETIDEPLARRKIIGDASEAALLRFCEELSPVATMRLANPKVYEVPFNSAHKWQLSIHSVVKAGSDRCVLYIKGAPERVMTMCNRVMKSGEPVPIGKSDVTAYEQAYERLAGNGERVLGFAMLELSEQFNADYPYDIEQNNFPLTDLVFVGLISLMDPPRQSVPEAIQKCHEAGVRVIMVTGDHPLTAVAIARQVGIISGDTVEDIAKADGMEVTAVDPARAEAVVVKGSEIDNLKAEDWDAILAKKQIVFARTSPEQKLTIVSECQRRGEIVAVTGDGVNDSPALKKADLGCAMGITGSDVSKEAADLVLLDDNFASIVTGIEEGRIIYDNLKKSICYTLSSNSAELLPFILFMLAQMPLALNAILILCIDLGTDMVPAISFAYERPESDIMRRKPRNQKHRLVSATLGIYSYVWLGMVQAIAGFINYFLIFWWEYGLSPRNVVMVSTKYFRDDAPDYMGYAAAEQLEIVSAGQTAFFVGVVLTRIGVGIVCKTRQLSLFRQGFSNWVFNMGILIELGLVVLLVNMPWLHPIFGTTSIGAQYWFLPLIWTSFLVATDELRQYLLRRNPHGWVRRTYW
eukprot:TRINITY_DN28115_c0_g1_i1.p1 TRINITY_DN28115_c0_g1~~TRINITY_DN28115_c0_g1_i1.p1  ORF type:complete len:1054 (-),score=327.67 TRINITY_DN28115_c0_g1_i1:227-3388(-)